MNLTHPAESLCLAHMAAEQAAGGSNEQLFLYIGLTSGVCERVSVLAVFVQRFSSIFFFQRFFYVMNRLAFQVQN